MSKSRFASGGIGPPVCGSGDGHALSRGLGAGRAFALGALALELAGAADCCCALPGALFRRLFVVTAQLHLAVDALALQLLLEGAQRLLDVIVANDDLHKLPSNSFKFRHLVPRYQRGGQRCPFQWQYSSCLPEPYGRRRARALSSAS